MVAFLKILIVNLLLVWVMIKTVSLVVVPVLTAHLGGFNTEIFTFMTQGVQAISITGVIFILTILFLAYLLMP